EPAVVLGGQFVQDRRDHFAGPAPFGPEVDQDGLVALEDQLLERLVGDLDRCAHDLSFIGSLSVSSREGPGSFPPPRPTARTAPAHARSASVSTTRDTSATTSGAP